MCKLIVGWLISLPATAPNPSEGAPGQARGRVVDYLRLTKPRSVLLLLLAALVGMVVSRPEPLPLGLLALTMLGGALAAGGANALNCWIDRDVDRLMARTARRPLPSGRIAPERALAFGLTLCVLAVALLASRVNWLSALLAAAGAAYYVVVYTWWLKRASHWNVVVGGGAGALPLLVGWTAATGGLSLWPLWLGAIVVCWTPPHFWALALVRREDYALAGVPMMPVVRGEEETRRQILLYSISVVALTVLLVPAGFMGIGFLPVALVLGGLLVYLAARLLRRGTDLDAVRMYRYSVVYLASLFLSMMVDRLGWAPTW